MPHFRVLWAWLAIMEIAAWVTLGRSDTTQDAAFLDRPLPPEVFSMLRAVPTPDPNVPGAQIQSPMIAVPSLAGAIELLRKISGKRWFWMQPWERGLTKSRRRLGGSAWV
jgi:hypothetical protein